MNQQVLADIRRMLHEAGIQYREVEHPPTHTSEESAKARGEELGVGAKALLLSMDGTFRLFVLPADRKLDSAAVKREFGVKQIRFATPEELLSETGLVPGSVPPFGGRSCRLNYSLMLRLASCMIASRSMPDRSLCRSSCRRRIGRSWHSPNGLCLRRSSCTASTIVENPLITPPSRPAAP